MLALYRRHRPRSFEQVVGQDHIVRTLRNAVDLGKVHHAYLFVGSRGTGKTSMAKLLACALNCDGGPRSDFAPDDPACVAIAAGSSLDVVEMDAASNNSVDDIRELRENVALAPIGGGSRVYILDEAHMLSASAWNAFLKTLEEPPAHAVFVLATTEAHKVPATIVDRCHRFDFHRPSAEQIASVLERVVAAESIEVPDTAVALIARAATGSFRDALATLEQLVTYGGDQIELEDVQAVLGVADQQLILDAADAIAAQDPRAALLAVERLAASGRDIGQFMRDFAEHLRRVYVTQTLGDIPDSFTLTAEHADRVAAQAERLAQPQVLRTIDLVGEGLTAVKDGSEPRLRLELALLKASQPPTELSLQALMFRIEQLERRIAGQSAAVEAPPERPQASPPESPQASPPEAGSGPETPPEPGPPADEPGPGPAAEALGLERVQQLWPAVLEAVREENAMVGALFAEASPAAFESGRLVIDFPADREFLKKKAEASGKLLAQALGGLTGHSPQLEYRLNGESSSPGALSEEELLARLREEFGAIEVDPGGARPEREEAQG